MNEICERDRKRLTSTKKHTACSDGFVGDGQSRSKVPRKRFMVWNLRPHGEIVERKLNTCKTTKRVDGLARTTKPKASPARAKANKTKARAKASLERAEARTRAKGRANNTARKRRNNLTKWRGTKANKKHKQVKNYTEWTDTIWDHADNWTDADWWSNDWSTDLWTDPAREQAARQLPSTQPAQEQSNPTQGGSISMLGGLTMCELSVDDGD